LQKPKSGKKASRKKVKPSLTPPVPTRPRSERRRGGQPENEGLVLNDHEIMILDPNLTLVAAQYTLPVRSVTSFPTGWNLKTRLEVGDRLETVVIDSGATATVVPIRLVNHLYNTGQFGTLLNLFKWDTPITFQGVFGTDACTHGCVLNVKFPGATNSAVMLCRIFNTPAILISAQMMWFWRYDSLEYKFRAFGNDGVDPDTGQPMPRCTVSIDSPNARGPPVARRAQTNPRSAQARAPPGRPGVQLAEQTFAQGFSHGGALNRMD